MTKPLKSVQIYDRTKIFTEGLILLGVPRYKWNMSHLFIDVVNIDKWCRDPERDRFFWSMNTFTGNSRLDFESKEYVKMDWEDDRTAIEVVFNPDSMMVDIFSF